MPAFLETVDSSYHRCRDGCVRTWSAVSGELQHEFRYPDTTASHVTFADVSSEAALVALAKATGVVDLLSLTDLSHVRQLNPPNDPGGAILGPVRVCRFSQDGSILAVGFDSGSLEVSLPYHVEFEQIFNLYSLDGFCHASHANVTHPSGAPVICIRRVS